MPPPARATPEEVVEEILLRLPPDEPASIIRASLVSKLWLGLLSSARFHVRYREFHGDPPMLGVLISNPWDSPFQEDEGRPVEPFISTTKFRARIPDDDGSSQKEYNVLDCRHGRVLLRERNTPPAKLAVWDPMTGHQRELQVPASMVLERERGLLGAAVLCAITGCDHRACHGGLSRVVFFSIHYVNGARFVAQACVSSLSAPRDCSEEAHRGEWSEPCPGLPIDTIGFIQPNPPILVKNAVHFLLGYEYESREQYEYTVWQHILKYDLSSNGLSLIDVPKAAARDFGDSVLMALEDGSLGFARCRKRLNLYIWSGHMGSDGVAASTRRKVISLKDIPPLKIPPHFFSVLGSVEGSDIIFVSTEFGIYQINLKTLRWKKIWEGKNINALIPYMCFYNPQEMVRACDDVDR